MTADPSGLLRTILQSDDAKSWESRLDAAFHDPATRASVIREIKDAVTPLAAGLTSRQLERLQDQVIAHLVAAVKKKASLTTHDWDAEDSAPSSNAEAVDAGPTELDASPIPLYEALDLDRLPHPVAVTVHKLVLTLRDPSKDGYTKLATLLVCFDATLRYLVAILLDAYRYSPACTPRNNEILLDSRETGLIRPSLGNWGLAAKRLSEWLAACVAPPADRVVRLFCQPGPTPESKLRETELCRACREFVEYRNDDIKYGATRDSSYQADLNRWLIRILPLVEGVADLADWRLTLVVEAHSCQEWMGLSPKAELQSGSFDPEKKEHLVLRGPGPLPQIRDLFPFLCFLPDADACKRLHYYDSVYRYQESDKSTKERKQAKIREYDLGSIHPSSEPIPGLEETFTKELLASAFNGVARRLEVIEGRVARQQELLAAHADIVGRHSTVAHVRAFVEHNDRGLLIIQAQPGKGKTALLAHLIQEAFADRRPTPAYYFYRRTSRETDPDQCVRNLYASLLAIHNISESWESRLLADPESMFYKFTDLLARIASTLDAGQRQLIFIDALDEALPTATGKTAFSRIPENLPPGIFIVATTRPVTERISLVSRPHLSWYNLDAPDLYQENLRDGFEYVRQQTAGRELSETTLREIARLGGGNFLVLKLVCRRISAQLDAGDVAALVSELATATDADRLGFVYQQFWDRAMSGLSRDEAQLVHDVAGVLVTASAPVTEEMVCQVLELKTADWDFAYRHLAEYLEPIVFEEEGVSQTYYRIYHNSFADFIRTKVAAERLRFHRLIADYCLRWSELPEGGREYALRFASEHLCELHDCQGLARLVDSDFVKAKAIALSQETPDESGTKAADAFSTLEALRDAGRIARTLAEREDEYWDELVKCAFQYCELVEELRGEPGAFERLIEEGQIERVLELIGNDEDKFRRGVLMLAVAPSIRRTGDQRRATDLESRGAALVAHEVTQQEKRPEDYSLVTACLASALASQATNPGRFPEGADFTETWSQRTWLPISEVLAEIDTIPSRRLLDFLWAPLAPWLQHAHPALWFVCGAVLMMAAMPYGALAERLPPEIWWVQSLLNLWLRILMFCGFACWIVAILCVPLLVFRRPLQRRLERAATSDVTWRLHDLRRRMLHEHDPAIHRGSLIKAVRIGRRYRQFVPRALLTKIVNRGFGSVTKEPQLAAGVVIDLAHIEECRGEPFCAAAVDQINALKEVQAREAIRQELASGHRLDRRIRPVLKALTETANESSDPAILLDFLQSYMAKVSWDSTIAVLETMHSPDLRKMTLRSLERDRLAESVPVLLRSTQFLPPFLAELRWPVIVLILVVFGPIVAMLGGILAVVFLFLGLWFLPFQRTLAAGLRARTDKFSEIEQKRRYLAEWVSRVLQAGERVAGVFDLQRTFVIRRMRNAILAQSLLCKDSYSSVLLATKSVLARITQRLVDEGLLSRSQVVLTMMTDRRCLRIATRKRPLSTNAISRRVVDEPEHERQLERVLALADSRLDYALTTTLAVLGISVYFAIVASGVFAKISPWLLRLCFYECLFIGFAIPVWDRLKALVLPGPQSPDAPRTGVESHAPELPTFGFGAKMATIGRRVSSITAGVLGTLVILTVFSWPMIYMFAHGSLLEQAEAAAFHRQPLTNAELAKRPSRVDGFPFLFVSYVIASFLVPDVIACWRGAYLFYPTAARLRIERIKLLCLVLVFILLMAWATALIER